MENRQADLLALSGRFADQTRRSWRRFNSEILPHRCNLTALGHIHNMYFVAWADYIAVCEPEHPSQRLSDPALVFRLPSTDRALHGDLEPDAPLSHAATHVVVERFGAAEEVLLVACDDGDVLGYQLADIKHAVDCRPRDVSGCDAAECRTGLAPFVHENVGASAWGLAVHRQARLMAVSCNAHDVLVFRIPPLEPADDGEEAAQQTAPVRLTGARHNIPHVAFDNTGADPTGRWLLGSVISGDVCVWDTHHAHELPRVFSPRFCNSASSQPGLTYCTCRYHDSLTHSSECEDLFASANEGRLC